MRHHFLSHINGATPLVALAASLVARRRWSFVAGACLVAAVALWLVARTSAAFVAATLGVVAWFWDERTRLRPVALEAERERRLRLGEEETGGRTDEINDDVEEFDASEHEGRGNAARTHDD